MLSVLGLFVFQLKSSSYQQLQHSDTERWKNQEVSDAKKRDTWQHLGPGEDTVTLSGTLYPEITGGDTSLDALRAMKNSGKSWIFMLGNGRIMGLYIIQSIEETYQLFFRNGKARKIDFSLKLTRVDDNYDFAIDNAFTNSVRGRIVY